MSLWPIPFTLFAAALLPIQAALNGALGRALHRPALVVMISLTGSLVFMVLFSVGTRMTLPSAGRFAAVPWWAWPAGVCGAIYLLSQPIVLPRIGAAVYMGLSVTAQIVTALLLDQFGALGVPQHTASPGRILGAGLMAAGIALIARY